MEVSGTSYSSINEEVCPESQGTDPRKLQLIRTISPKYLPGFIFKEPDFQRLSIKYSI